LFRADSSSPSEVANYAKYIKENIVSRCPEEAGVEECFGSHDDAKFKDDGLDQEWRLWLFQGALSQSSRGGVS
jgi:hypothetical protein